MVTARCSYHCLAASVLFLEVQPQTWNWRRGDWRKPEMAGTSKVFLLKAHGTPAELGGTWKPKAACKEGVICWRWMWRARGRGASAAAGHSVYQEQPPCTVSASRCVCVTRETTPTSCDCIAEKKMSMKSGFNHADDGRGYNYRNPGKKYIYL